MTFINNKYCSCEYIDSSSAGVILKLSDGLIIRNHPAVLGVVSPSPKYNRTSKFEKLIGDHDFRDDSNCLLITQIVIDDK